MQGLVKKLKRLRIGDVALRRNPIFYDDARRFLAAVAHASPERRRELMRARVRQSLAIAARTPYGQQVGGGTELHEWPLLTKEQACVAPRALRRGTKLFTIRDSTGGTSGTALALTRSLRSIVFEQACLDTMMRELGVDARRARVAVLRADEIKPPDDLRPPYWVCAAGGRRLLFSSAHLNSATVAAYVKALHEFNPDVLYVHPSAIESLVMLIAQRGLQCRIARVLSSSEVLHTHVWEQVASTLHCSILDYYGQAERVAIAFATTSGAYRFLPGYSYVELVPCGGVEEDGQSVYEIVGTSLWNPAMPLVRYRTGDLVRVPAEWGAAQLEELALGVRTFGGVLGRDGDVLIAPDGTRLIGLSHFQRDVPNIVRIQIVQENPHLIRIRVLTNGSFGIRDEQRLLRNVRMKVPASMEVRIERAEQLERTARGKTPFVIRRMSLSP